MKAINIFQGMYHEAYEQAQMAVNWTVGGYENDVVDGNLHPDDLPSFEELRDEIYDEWMHTTYYIDGVGPGPIPSISANPDPMLYKAMVTMALAQMYIDGELDWMDWD